MNEYFDLELEGMLTHVLDSQTLQSELKRLSFDEVARDFSKGCISDHLLESVLDKTA